VVVTNFPVDGFLAHDRLAEMRPDLITVRVMGHADGTPALDYTVNAAVGIPGITGPAELGAEPVNHVLPAWDLLTGAYAAFALLAALRHRERTGEGQEVRIALADVAVGTVANLGMLAEAQMTGAERPRLGTSVYAAFGRAFATRDGRRLMLLAITPRQWRGLVRVLGIGEEVARIEAARGVSFATDESLRADHGDALYPLVEAKIAGWDYPALAAALETEGCCFGPYRSMVETAADPAMVLDNPLFGRTENASGLDYPAAGSFATLPAHPRAPIRPAPHLGQDGEGLLGALLGLNGEAVAALQADGLVGRPSAP
jgi:2-methylfumaryl-CoA isomerase